MQTFANTAAGLKQLLTSWNERQPQLICLEATGGYERAIVDLLQEHLIAVAVVNPRQIRDFARAGNQLAKPMPSMRAASRSSP